MLCCWHVPSPGSNHRWVRQAPHLRHHHPGRRLPRRKRNRFRSRRGHPGSIIARVHRVEFWSTEDAGRPPRNASARAWAAWIAAAMSAGCDVARGVRIRRSRFLSVGAGAAVDDLVGAAGIAVGSAASGPLAPGSTDKDAGMATGSRPGAASSSSARVRGCEIAAVAAGAAEIAAMRAACIALPSHGWITTAEARAAQQSRTSPSSLPLLLVGATGLGRWAARAR
jgi:hypothetical protein